jgi:ribA/ribD-fused uncharacterized protein
VTDKTYCCSEQCFFASKAEYLGDFDALTAIMQQQDGAGSLFEGKKIKNYTKKNWEQVEDEAMKRANREKFLQNAGLKTTLMSTLDRKLAECSLYDKKWGIGHSMNGTSKENQAAWGDNKFGECLMILRKEFKEMPQNPMETQQTF